MKKIAFIIQHLTNGGAERTISNLSIELASKYDITLIVFDGNNVTYPYGGKLIDLAIPPVDGMFGKIINIIKRCWKVNRIKKKENFDCVISFMFGGNIVNVFSKHREKIVVSARNYMSSYGLKLTDIIRERVIAYLSDVEITLSKSVELDLVKNFGLNRNKVKTIYNPVDVEKIKELATETIGEYEFDPSIYYFINAGRMVSQKGQWHLIKAFSEFKKNMPNSKLIILGDGPMKQALVELAERLGVKESVDFLGFVSNPYKYFYRSSCFVLSSTYEGLGNVILEAMACELPVISYDCLAGPRELLAPELSFDDKVSDVYWSSCGILVQPATKDINLDNEFELADKRLFRAMNEIYINQNNGKKCVYNASNRLEMFRPSKIAEEWEKYF